MGTILALIPFLLNSVLFVVNCGQDVLLVEEFTVGSFRQAARIVVEPQGSVYILDAGDNTLLLYSDLHDPPKVIGGFGWSASSFDKPTGVATDGVNVYVSDYGNHRVQRFDRNLNFVSSLSTRDTTDIASRFGYPLDVALSELGDLFILDGENYRVLKFNPLFERSIGDIDAGEGRIHDPVKIIASMNRVVVGERNRIVLYDYFGNYLGCVGKGIVSELISFAVASTGFIAASSDTIWWFTKDGLLGATIPRVHIIGSERVDPIQDIDFSGNRIFILTARRLHVFKVVN